MSANTTNVCYAINEGYVDYCRVSMISLFENNKNHDIAVHILTDTLSETAVQKLRHTTKTYGGLLEIYEIDDEKLKGQKLSWSKYGWYRIFAGELLPETVNRLLYLDCDVIVESDISDLFGSTYFEKEDWSVAGVPDIMSISQSLFDRVGYPKEKGYFCSGVLMMNLDYFRKNNLADKILKFAIDNPDKIYFPDQDALNCVCQDSKILLPLKYGILDPFYRNLRFMEVYKEEVLDSLDNPKIIHYAGCAPWIAENNRHLFYDRFWKYASIAGGIKKRHCCSGSALLKLRIKKMLGRMGIGGFKRYVPAKRLHIDKVRKTLINL